MPRTIEGIVEAHRVATERRRAGRPIWDHTLNVSMFFHNEELSFEQMRDGVVRRLRAMMWCKNSEEVRDLAQELSECSNEEEFNDVWDALYDVADQDRVWIKTH